MLMLGPSEFYETMGQKNHSKLLLLSFNSKLSHFDKNLNFHLNINHKWFSPTWRKPIRFDLWRSPRTFKATVHSISECSRCRFGWRTFYTGERGKFENIHSKQN
jgi:hypothetical protein